MLPTRMKAVYWLFVSIFCIFLEYGNTETTSCETRFMHVSAGLFLCPQVECASVTIWGTVKYTDDSSICAAAWHDGRIKPWSTNPLERTVTWLPGGRVSVFRGTARYGISSNSFPLYYSAMFFTSERVSETLYDISTVVDTAAKTILCFGRGNADPRNNTELIAGVFVQTSAYRSTTAPTKTPDAGAVTLRCDRYKYAYTGAYFCTTSGDKENLYSRVVTLAQETDYIVFTPDSVTIRASVGDNVTFSVSTTRSIVRETIRWERDSVLMTAWNGKLQQGLRVDIGHSGVYNVYSEGSAWFHTMIRLIVRVCPRGTFGGRCQHTCPFCVNGGICHDITGECVCPPGFKGVTCEEACGSNRFGRECTAACAEPSSIDGCKSKTICTLDPYGCSCATGFYGFKCDKACPTGKYGADCAQTCGSCKQEPCDRFTGHCSRHGCEVGHYTDFCIECPSPRDVFRLISTFPGMGGPARSF